MGALKAPGVGWTEKEVQAQSSIEEKVGALKKLESDNATKTVGKDIGKEQSAAAEHTLKMGELGIAAEQLASDISLADKEY
jgi:hypothetical protein